MATACRRLPGPGHRGPERQRHGACAIIEGEQTRAARQQREAVEAKAAQGARAAAAARPHADRDLSDRRGHRAAARSAPRAARSQYRVTEQNITNLRERQARLQQQIARFKPYSDKPNAPPLPDHLAEEMVNTVNGLRVYQRIADEEHARNRRTIKSSFDADISALQGTEGNPLGSSGLSSACGPSCRIRPRRAPTPRIR